MATAAYDSKVFEELPALGGNGVDYRVGTLLARADDLLPLDVALLFGPVDLRFFICAYFLKEMSGRYAIIACFIDGFQQFDKPLFARI